MNSLVLSLRPAYPPDNGRERRVWEECRQLATYGDVYLAAPSPETTIPHESIQYIPLPSRVLTHRGTAVQAWNASHLLGRYNVYHRLLSRHVRRLVERQSVPFDIVTSDSPQLATAAGDLAERHGARFLLSKQNATYTLLEEFLEPTPLPGFLQYHAVAALRRLEQETIERADAVVFQSDADRDLFDVPERTIAATTPNGTNYWTIREGGNPAAVRSRFGITPRRFVCVFIGSYDYFANRVAADVISEEFAPALPDIAFLLVGRDPPSVTADNVYAPGFVDDLPGVLSVADVALCPLQSGSGTKLKMMDYLAAGLPIVTTETGAIGIDLEDETTALVRDVEEFVPAIERLRDSPQLRSRLSANASELGKQYDWSSVLAPYDRIVEELFE